MIISTIDIRPEELVIVREILHRHIPDREVFAFGSRVHGTAKKFSDLDLVVMGEEPLSASLLSKLREAFEMSDLPFRVDIVDWAETSAEFRKVIEGQGKVGIQG